MCDTAAILRGRAFHPMKQGDTNASCRSNQRHNPRSDGVRDTRFIEEPLPCELRSLAKERALCVEELGLRKRTTRISGSVRERSQRSKTHDLALQCEIRHQQIEPQSAHEFVVSGGQICTKRASHASFISQLRLKIF